MENTLINDDCGSAMKAMPENCIDLIASDPPYQLSSGKGEAKAGFMGKEWDVLPTVETLKECLRVLKPGAFAFWLMTPRQDSLCEFVSRLRQAGFVTAFTSIYWCYACLTSDTEVLTKNGWLSWEQLRKTIRHKNERILLYDDAKDSYLWEKPSAWNHYRIAEEGYHIKSRFTDQFVSANHRVFAQGKTILAEELRQQERVAYLSKVPEGILDMESMAQEKVEKQTHGDLLLNLMSPKSSHCPTACGRENTSFSNVRRSKGKIEKKNDRREELGVERGGNILQDQRQLCGCQVCQMPNRLSHNGSERWICDGTPTHNRKTPQKTSIEDRSGASPRPQPDEQQHQQFGSIQKQQRAQIKRTRTSYRTTLATVSKEYYEGEVFCPTVSTGLFVARRKGKIFITGNSGFPKAANTSKLIDRKLGFERKVVAEKEAPSRANAVKAEKWGYNSGVIPITAAASEQAKAMQGAYNGFQPKPAIEVIVVSMKPLSEKSYTEQALKNGKGVTWLDDARIPYQSKDDAEFNLKVRHNSQENVCYSGGSIGKGDAQGSPEGRFPANLLVSDDVLDDGTTHKGRRALMGSGVENEKPANVYGKYGDLQSERGYDDEGNVSRYFSLDAWYRERIRKLPKEVQDTFPCLIVPKPAASEKNVAGNMTIDNTDKYDGKMPCSKADKGMTNHPTVKPLALMSYLITLGSREGDTVLDPYMGSGTTCAAAYIQSRKFVGIERDSSYFAIAKERVGHYTAQKKLGDY